ncbi:hypothetical protein PGTUg99_033579 [Puccinia graminis f. sp. tritici]|uniref:Prolyl 4-hydroxylase alpha subunit Fe(2+) 2OG dioxygenase domain-containing protein n=1 Tax=Puccinia graminis f. sp. tritici TaxID=56615 RepID=A0A5B0QSX6_PUCGR|nr:hypothetical protein PGTUg99_033579 [Puccinia graminis f. sp. tritici]
MSYPFSAPNFDFTANDDMDISFYNLHDTMRSLRAKPKPRKQHVELKGDLFKAFQGISAPGTFAAWEALPTTPPAGLHVDGVGQISLPLDEGQIRRLIQKSHQAPYGRRSETLVDLSVRNTWEINGDQLLFLNPSWQSYLLDLSKTVANRLGINAPIRVELYKMLIYERGAMFKPHTDTEKTPGMFGTLIICLPSAHTGGEVVARHNGESMILKTSDAIQSFACWYSDVSHEVLPVHSGYRCVLTYNLATWPDQPRPAASTRDSQVFPLRETLQRWIAESANSNPTDTPSHLYHALDHEYTEASISFAALKAKDAARVQALKNLTSELPFEIFLALLEKKEMGDVEHDWSRGGYDGWGRYHEDFEPECDEEYDDDEEDDDEDEDEDEDDEDDDRKERKKAKNKAQDKAQSKPPTNAKHKITDVFETEYNVGSLCTLDGDTLASDYNFDSSFCLVDDPFEEMGVDQEEYEPYMGNSGPSATHWYRRSALVIVPRQRLGEFLAESVSSESNLTSALSYLKQVLPRPEDQIPLLDAMAALYQSMPSKFMFQDTITDTLQTALCANHRKLFESVGARHGGMLPVDFFDWAKGWLDTLPAQDRAEKYQAWIPLLIQGYPLVTSRITIIAKLFPNPTGHAALPDPALTNFNTWARDQMHQCIKLFIQNTQNPTVSDIDVIMSALAYLDEATRSAFLKSIFDHFTQAHATAFLLALLSRLKAHAVAGYPQNSAAMELYRNLSLRVFNSRRRLSELITPTKTSWSHRTDFLVTQQDLIQFACDLNDMNTDGASLLQTFIEEINSQCSTFLIDDLREFWMPFLYQLIPTLVSRSIPLNTPACQQLTSQFIKHLDEKTLGPCPHAPAGVLLQNPQVSCPCMDCDELNKFLRSTTQRVARFRKAKAKRTHLEQQITRARLPCTHETERGGNPLTLVVMKRYIVQDQLDKWKKQQKKLYVGLVKSFQPKQLQSLLGDQEASRIRALAGL